MTSRSLLTIGLCLASLGGLAGCESTIAVNASTTTTGSGGAASSSSTGAGGALGSSSSSVGGGFGVSSSSSSGGIDAGACPAVSPNDGDPCTTPGLTCTGGGYCCGISASCDGQTWHIFNGIDCGQPCFDCQGSASCNADAVCVVYTTSPGSPGHCAANPCNGEALSCTCASSVCLHDACDHTSGDTVSCVGALGGP